MATTTSIQAYATDIDVGPKPHLLSHTRHILRHLRSIAMRRDYENALRIIESRQRRSRPAAPISSTSKDMKHPGGSTPELRGSPSIEGMSRWLELLGYLNESLNGLSIIHVAGTKGKGSTCAFIESFLRARGQRTGYPGKTGLYTTPHLINPEERIRINSRPLGPDLFAKYLFDVYDKLPQLAQDYDPAKPPVERGPRYLQLYALLAFHVFIREGVDAAIIETHSGGEYDATNVIQKPLVTAITTLGMDHVDMLGPTIQHIAWHKAGIFKAGAEALSTVQQSGLNEVLEKRAESKGARLKIMREDSRIPAGATQLKPAVQRSNASLAIAACEAWLGRKCPSDSWLTTEDIQRGIEQWSWPGRFQKIYERKRIWFLDAAHNDMSVKLAAQWFAESSTGLSVRATRVLVFTHINELRDVEALLQTLATALQDAGLGMNHVIFTTYHASQRALKEVRQQASISPSFHQIWRRVFPGSEVHERLTIDAAVEHAKGLERDNEVHILITGSQHLVGPALQLLEREADKTSFTS